MIIYGGSGYHGFYNDLYIYDFDKNEWSVVKEDETFPHARHGHSACLVNDEMIVFGGHYTDWKKKFRQFFNDVHILDLQTFKFRELLLKENIPHVRSWHSSISIKNGSAMLVFGGFYMSSKEFYLNDLYILDIKGNKWIKIDQSELENIPNERNRCSCVLIKENEDITSIFLFGGNFFNMKTGRDDFYNDGYVLNLEGRDLEKLKVEWKKFEDESAPKRGHHTCTLLNGTIYIFGGEYDRKRFNDLYSVSLKY